MTKVNEQQSNKKVDMIKDHKDKCFFDLFQQLFRFILAVFIFAEQISCLTIKHIIFGRPCPSFSLYQT